MANRANRAGYLGFITNHSYLDNPTFRGMRQSLMNTFTDIYILNLHGNPRKKRLPRTAVRMKMYLISSRV